MEDNRFQEYEYYDDREIDNDFKELFQKPFKEREFIYRCFPIRPERQKASITTMVANIVTLMRK